MYANLLNPSLEKKKSFILLKTIYTVSCKYKSKKLKKKTLSKT